MVTEFSASADLIYFFLPGLPAIAPVILLNFEVSALDYMASSINCTNSSSSIKPLPFLSNAFNNFLKLRPAKESGKCSLTAS